MAADVLTARPRLTRVRTCIAVVMALAAGLVTAAAVSGAAIDLSGQVVDTGSNQWEPLGVLIRGLMLAAALEYVVAVAIVALIVRGRAGALRFVGLFATAFALILWLHTLFAANNWFSPMIMLLYTPGAAAPLLWAVPAAAVGLLRWRWTLPIVVTNIVIGVLLLLATRAS